MNYLRDLLNFFFELMQHRMTLYIYIFFLILGVAIMIAGLIIYSRKRGKDSTKVPKKYLVMPIVGAILVGCEILQIAFYLLVVNIW